jgi:hypothetical protein
MRICAVSLPELRIELVRSELASAGSPLAASPLAVVVAEAPMTESTLLGSTRLSVVSPEARTLGVFPGQSIAQARARVAGLKVRVVRPEAVEDVLARLAEVGLAFGATVSFGVESASSKKREASRKERHSDFGDVVWIDVTGCAHLHAPRAGASLFDSETILAARLAKAVRALGHRCAVALADGPRVAAMLARAAAEAQCQAESAASRRARRERERERERERDFATPIVVPPGGNAEALASLPVSSLPLLADEQRWLTKLGIRTLAQVRALPRDELGARLGPRARDVLSLLHGDDRAPLRRYVPPEIPEEALALEVGIEGAEALTFVAKTLTDRLASRLAGRGVAASRLELLLSLDRGVLAATDQAVYEIALDLPAPLSAASDWLAALRPRIERLTLGAPVLNATLRAPKLVHKQSATLSLLEPEPAAEEALPRLVAELASDLGPESVCMLVLGDSWLPEERSTLVPFRDAHEAREARASRSSKKTEKPMRRLLSTVPEPTRLCAQPIPIAREHVRIVRHLSRVESVAWWKKPPSGPRETHAQERAFVDRVQAWTNAGPVFVEIDRSNGAMHLRGWFD